MTTIDFSRQRRDKLQRVVEKTSVKSPTDYLDKGPFSHRLSGRYYGSTNMIGAAFTTGAMAANKIYLFPFVVVKDENYSKIAIEVTAADAVNSNVRLGIYKNTPDDVNPGTLLGDYGVVDVSSNGVKSITVDIALKKSISLYWLAAISDGTASTRKMGSTNSLAITGSSVSIGANPSLSKDLAQAYGVLPTSVVGNNISGTSGFIFLLKA